MATESIGGLRCRLLGGPRGQGISPDLVVVLCHGYGAPGGDLVPLAAEVIEDDPVLGSLVRFVLPAAPVSLGGFMPDEPRAWWLLDDDSLEAAFSSGRPLDYRRETPEGMAVARDTLSAFLESVGERERLPLSRFVLGGFSQGAMLCLETALRLPENPAGLALFSGSLVCEQEWTRLAPTRRGLPVLLSHGRQDPLLSYDAAETLRDLLRRAGLEVEWLPFDGPHTIPAAVVRRLASWLRSLLLPGPERRPAFGHEP